MKLVGCFSKHIIGHGVLLLKKLNYRSNEQVVKSMKGTIPLTVREIRRKRNNKEK